MPYFSQLADIAFIPFKVTPMTASVNPIKLYEYCAAGLPTVVSAFKTVLDIKGPYFIYRRIGDVEQKLKYASEALVNNAFVEEIVAFAKLNSWNARFQQIETVIGEV